jgi:nicotinamidase-related amidase
MRRMGMNQLVKVAAVLGVALAVGGLATCADSAQEARTCSTALLVIDVQNAYVDTLDLTTIDGVPLVPQLVTVLAAARAAGLPIVYIQHRDPRYSVGDPLLDTASPIAPLPGEPIVWKTHGDAFWDTELADVLSTLGASRILVTGLATTGCVDATAQGAVRLGYDTWVIADAQSGGGDVGVLAYYNNELWPGVGVTVKSSEEIDFAAFGGSPPQP